MAFYDVRDIDRLAREADCREDLIEQLAGLTHKGFSLPVLLEARSFTDEHDFRRRGTDTERGINTLCAERTLAARLDFLGEVF